VADTDTETDLILPRDFRALARLERDFLPTRGGRLHLPCLRRLKPVPGPIRDDLVHVPGWEWERPTPPGTDLITLDVNAAWPSACSSARYAHGNLKRTQYRAFDGSPGLWQCDLRGWRWGFTGDLMSPLGTSDHRERPWLASPTVALLMELIESGHAPEFPITDSWTSDEPVRLSKWATWIKETRNQLREDGELELLAQFKISYSIAITMIKEGDGCDLKRPDWYYTTLAQTAATQWRRMWRCVLAGRGPVRAGSVDEVQFTADDLTDLLDMDSDLRPFQIDPSGSTLGTYKIKE
jgi:hypothetical protein